jgi:hypothetical protein
MLYAGIFMSGPFKEKTKRGGGAIFKSVAKFYDLIDAK